MDYEIKSHHGMNIIGIELRTNNEKAAKEIPAFWAHVQEHNLLGFIPKRINTNRFYAMYTDYEKDASGEYSLIIGAEVVSLVDTPVPENMVSRVIPGGTYAVFTAKGELIAQAVGKTWQTIWDTKLDRTYAFDFEVYDLELLSKKEPEVPIYVAIKSSDNE